MTEIYLIRHGQAGSRLCYDELSELGLRQAELLAGHLNSAEWTAVYSGALQRQRHTAGIAAPSYAPIIDPRWNEFDLDEVYRCLGPVIAEEDREFAAAWREQQRAAEDLASPIHRAWSPCDVQVMRAWVEGRYPMDGETFEAFQARVESALRDVFLRHPGGAVAVFTSATPIGLSLGAALHLSGRKALQLAGTMINTAINVFHLHEEDVRLFQYNAVPHLPRELWTHR